MLPPLVPLLKQDTTRSDAPESPPAASPIQPTTASIELEELAPSANLAFHSATGKFAERAHETAFAARLFRLAYPGHVLLMALALALTTWMASVAPPGLRVALAALATVCTSFALVGRIILHRMDDLVRAQRLGSWTWTTVIVLICIADASSFVMPPSEAQHGQSAPLAQCPRSSRASSGRAWQLWLARRSHGETGPLGASPLP